MRDIYIYLYFLTLSEEYSVWDDTFCVAFRKLVHRIFERNVVVFSNKEVTDDRVENKSFKEVQGSTDIFILISGGDEKSTSGMGLKEMIGLLGTEQKSSIFIVRRSHGTLTGMPLILSTYPHYNFYFPRQQFQSVFLPDSDGQEESEQEFWDKLTELVYDVKYSLLSFARTDIPLKRNNTVFLAEVTSDQAKNRDRLRRELILSGYQVLPQTPLPLSLKEFEDTVSTCLEKSILSVHLMGESYGDTPQGLDYSYQEIQNKLFTEVSKKLDSMAFQTGINRIVWIPAVFEPFEEKQVQYMKRLRKEISLSSSSELIQSHLFDLKSIIEQKMIQVNSRKDTSVSDHPDKILLISDDYNNVVYDTFREEFLQTSLDFTSFGSILPLKSTGMAMNELKKYKNVVILNTRNEAIWLSAMLRLIARSKGYREAVIPAFVGLFSPFPVDDMYEVPGLQSLKILGYFYTGKTLRNILLSYISSVKNDRTDS